MNNQEFKTKLEDALNSLLEAKALNGDIGNPKKIVNLDFIIEKMEEYVFRANSRINSDLEITNSKSEEIDPPTN